MASLCGALEKTSIIVYNNPHLIKMSKVAVLIILFSCLSGFISPPAFSDMVYLKNKNNIEGIIEKEGETTVILNIGCGKITLEKKDIQNIYRYSPQEQEDLKKRWRYQYFAHPEFIPENLKDIAQDFNNLENERGVAIESKRATEQSKEKIEGLENELEKLNANLAQVSAKLSGLKAEDNVKEYNSLVEESNSLLAQINLDEYNKEALKKQLITLDKNISGYINDLRLFKKKLDERRGALSKETKEESKYFFDGVKRKIDGMESDFTKHIVDYNRRGSSIIVEALLNDLVKANLILDTGASLVVISPEIMDKLGLDIKKGVPILTTLADGRKVKAKLVILESIKVKGVEVKNVQAAVLENQETTTEDGLLGMSFLENFMLKIDAKDNKLILEEFNPP